MVNTELIHHNVLIHAFDALKAQDFLTETLTGDAWKDGFAEGRFLWEDANDQRGHW